MSRKDLEQLLLVAILVLGVPVLTASYKLYVLWAVPASHTQGTRNALSPRFNSFGVRFISLTEELQRKESIKLAEPKQDFSLGRNWVFWVTV